MADIFSQQAYHGTFVAGAITFEEHYQLCVTADINASNMLEATFWVNVNGNRADTNLSTALYRMRDKAGNLVSGLTQSGIVADVNGYFRITAVSAALIYDLSHYLFEVELSIDDQPVTASVGLVIGE